MCVLFVFELFNKINPLGWFRPPTVANNKLKLLLESNSRPLLRPRHNYQNPRYRLECEAGCILMTNRLRPFRASRLFACIRRLDASWCGCTELFSLSLRSRQSVCAAAKLRGQQRSESNQDDDEATTTGQRVNLISLSRRHVRVDVCGRGRFGLEFSNRHPLSSTFRQ